MTERNNDNRANKLPPEPKRWPTAKEFRQAALEENPYEQWRELRRRCPLASGKTLHIIIR